MHQVNCRSTKVGKCEKNNSTFHTCTRTLKLTDEQWQRANGPYKASVTDFCKGHKCKCKATW